MNVRPTKYQIRKIRTTLYPTKDNRRKVIQRIRTLTVDNKQLRNGIKEAIRLSYLGNLSEVQQALKEA